MSIGKSNLLMKRMDAAITTSLSPQAREPGLRPLPWPPFKGRDPAPYALGALACAWAASFILAVLLGFLSKHHHAYNYPVGDWRLGFYPPWTISLLWALWFGWAYGATIAALSGLILALTVQPTVGVQGTVWLGAADALGIWITCRILYGFPLDTRVRSLRDAALFSSAVLLGAVVAANGAFVEALVKPLSPIETMQRWESWWLGHFVESLLLAVPLTALLGGLVERWKARHFDCPPQAGTFSRQVLGVLLGGLALVLFYSAWMQAPDARMIKDLERPETSLDMRPHMLESYRNVSQHRGVVMASLLVLLGVGAWMLLAQRRRFELQLDEQVQHAARGPHAPGALAILYRLSQDVAEASDADTVLRRTAEAALQITGAGEAAVLVEKTAEGQNVLVVEAYASDGDVATTRIGQRVLASEAGLLRDCLRQGQPVAAGFGAPDEPEHMLTPTWKAVAVAVTPVDSGPDEPQRVLALAFPSRPASTEAFEENVEVARMAGTGLRRLRMFEVLRQQTAELALIEHVGRALSEHLSIDETLDRLMANVRNVVKTEWCAVFEYDAEARELVMRATSLPHPDAKAIRIPIASQSFAAACFREGRLLVSVDLRNDPRANPLLNEKYGTRSGMVAPLGPLGSRFGVFLATNPYIYAYNQVDMRHLEQLAALASAALERARLYEEVHRRAEELALLNEAGAVLVEQPDVEDSLRALAELMRRHFHAAGAGFLLKASSKDELVVTGAVGLGTEKADKLRVPLNTPGVITQAFREQQALAIEDNRTDPRAGRILDDVVPNMRSGAVVPMRTAHHCVGVLGVFDEHVRRFTPDDLRRLEAVGRLAAAAVERGELGKALRQTEARVLEILDATPAVVIGVGLDGRILNFNTTAERVTGYLRNEALGRNCMELLYPEPVERARVERLLAETFRTGVVGSGETTTLVTRAGQSRKLRWSGEPLLDAEGKLSGVVSMGLDVTEQIQLHEQFLQAQKMESVGALAGGMAHDFNNLLGGILGQAALAHGQLRTTDPLHTILKKIETAAQRGADLTSKLLTFARQQVLQPMPVDVGLLLRETAELLAGSLPKGITVISQITPGLPKVEGDPTQLQQVLLNLCVNARDAMPEGGTLTLKAAPGTAGGVRLEIRDTGMGISDEVKTHLYEPFFTTKEKGKGTGLGLAVVFGIVRSHNGSIEVESAPDAGACFSIHLPAMAHVPAAAVGAEVFADQLRLRGEYAGTEEVLLIDDEAILRETTEKLLQVLGYRVATASDGEEALRKLDARETQPRIVVLDVVMPGLAGVRLLEEIRKRLPTTPVLLISGYSRDLEVRRMLQTGALELIQKPFRIDELAGAIRRALHTPSSRTK